jgi:PleD family two-component response regulator
MRRPESALQAIDHGRDSGCPSVRSLEFRDSSSPFRWCSKANKIRNLAFFDSLTQLPNRRLLIDRLGQAVASATRQHQYGALLFLDLDYFKLLNDTEGH